MPTESWRSLSSDSRHAAAEALASGRWRSCVSRSYYAAYAAIAAALRDVPVPMPSGREGPNHGSIPRIVEHSLTTHSPAARRTISLLIKTLYDLRLAADYHPSVSVGKDEAEASMDLLDQLLEALKLP